MEADLQMYAGVDLRDYWRRDSDGRRLLSLRRIRVLVRALPDDSMTAVVDGGLGWRTTDLLISDLISVWTEGPHPADPRVERQKARERVAVEAARARSRARRERLGITGSVLRQI